MWKAATQKQTEGRMNTNGSDYLPAVDFGI